MGEVQRTLKTADYLDWVGNPQGRWYCSQVIAMDKLISLVDLHVHCRRTYITVIRKRLAKLELLRAAPEPFLTRNPCWRLLLENTATTYCLLLQRSHIVALPYRSTLFRPSFVLASQLTILLTQTGVDGSAHTSESSPRPIPAERFLAPSIQLLPAPRPVEIHEPRPWLGSNAVSPCKGRDSGLAIYNYR